MNGKFNPKVDTIRVLHVWQTFEDAPRSKYITVLNAYMRLYMQGLYRVLMSEYGSICLNVPEYAWTLLNVPEYTWKCTNKLFWICQGSQCVSSSYIFDRIYALGIKYTRVLNMPWYSYNNIIIELMLLY